MKLYEFTITDNECLNENQLLEHALEIMESEAETHGWIGCRVEKLGTGEKQTDGSVQYSFVVHGEVTESSKDQDSSEKIPPIAKERLAASSLERP
jgi:hypothetical protein